jgi:hypothetical protein
MTFVRRNVNADRICDGISRIGYRPHAALADIVDNSIAAQANKILISIGIEEGSTLSERNNISSFTIIDNGRGMDDTGLCTALDLGSLVTYEDNSLSKYGLGLKSAGLSLGDRVVVLSKRNGTLTKQHALDREAIREQQAYGVCIEEPDHRLTALLDAHQSGTVVQVTNVHSPLDSATTVLKNLSEQLGVIYYEFLSRTVNPVSIEILYASKRDEIKPLDIMVSAGSQKGFNPDSYDGKTPCVVADESLALYDSDGTKRSVPIKIVILPKDSMSKHLAFSLEERASIESYRVSRKNSGFFIYRNKRLIRWGDNLGIVGKDHYGFRARIDIQTEHDDLLHVDVSKQHLVLSEEFLDALKIKCRIPLSQMAEAFKICEEMRDGGSLAEGKAASQTLEDLAEEDPEQASNPPDPKTKKERRKKAQGESKKQVSKDGDDGAPDLAGEFAKVRYTDKMKSTALWSAENDPTYHTYVRINKNHQFYQLILGRLQDGSQARIAIETLIYMIAVGENITIENLDSVEYEQIKAVLDKFKRAMSLNLENWAAHNQDIMG